MVKKDKPDPEMILKTINALNTHRKNTVLVGDSIVDMEMGKRAEIALVVGVLEGGIAMIVCNIIFYIKIGRIAFIQNTLLPHQHYRML